MGAAVLFEAKHTMVIILKRVAKVFDVHYRAALPVQHNQKHAHA